MSDPHAKPERPEPHVLVLFGARGDLAQRKLLPGLYRLMINDLMASEFAIIGSGRHEPEGDFADEVREALQKHLDEDLQDEDWARFSERLSFVKSSSEDAQALQAAVAQARERLGDQSRSLLYLSVPPSAMGSMVEMISSTGLCDERTRIVMEKPFGSDLATARELNELLHEHIDEQAIFRIDHFLGQEAAQDILALRFANGLFEPIWNRRQIASVQIDVPEDLGLEGRGSFYEETGAFRDMVVTHLSQILGFLAIEPPSKLDAQSLHEVKAAVFAQLRPIDPQDCVLGQFDGYREEEGVAEDSQTDTFTAVRLLIDNDRWKGVPFLLRTGKNLAESRRVVSIAMREPEHSLFDTDQRDKRPDELVIELTDDPLISVELRVKAPGPTSQIVRAALRLDVERELHASGLQAYERLLHDVMLGDHLLFTRADEIESLWAWAAPLLENRPEPLPYARGSWGPPAAEDLAAPTRWRLPEDG